MHRLLYFLAVISTLWAAGCAAPPPPEGPTVARVSVDDPAQYEQLWEAATDTLRAYQLRPDRQDRLEGVLTSHPETSATALELWRAQPTPAYYWAESNMATIQRRAEIHFQPTNMDTYDIQVEVDRLRYSLEERQIDNSAAALRLFSAEAPTMSGRIESPSKSAEWIPVGRDEQMEQAILSGILKRFAQTPAPPATQPE
ncbi:MAG: hypothetical protein AMXMBFR13_36170 [Phycisphaerae bacterium]